jgi:glycosyltransferase involved in cell wall biosynthesis
MKIAILAGMAQAGGAERVTVTLANAFSERGHEVDLVCVLCTAETLGDLSPKVNKVELRARRARSAIFEFRRYIKSARPDAILAITYEMNMTAALATLGMKHRPRLILSVHGPLSRLKAANALWRAAATAISRVVYKKADYVVAVSDGVADELVTAGWADRAHVRKIYNPVITRDFEARAAEPLPPHVVRKKGVPTIISVGRLSPEKDHMLLLEAFSSAVKQQEAWLWIVGEGPMRPVIEERIAQLGLGDRVQLVGYVGNPLPLIRAADLFVLTSDREGFGVVLAEALGVGTPVVSTDCPHGPRDILGTGRWGSLVPMHNAKALAAAMLDALLGGAIDGQDRASDFTVEASADQYLALMQGSLAAP